jgi:hypothetical protein
MFVHLPLPGFLLLVTLLLPPSCNELPIAFIAANTVASARMYRPRVSLFFSLHALQTKYVVTVGRCVARSPCASDCDEFVDWAGLKCVLDEFCEVQGVYMMVGGGLGW